jgi:formylglycine-generating enzyme required for sulfatase activity
MAPAVANVGSAGAPAADATGLYDMAGDVWQWTSDWYRPDYYHQLVARGGVTRNPEGPESAFDPAEPGHAKKAKRGGSFFVPINIARAIWWERGARAISIQGQTTLAFAVS